MGQETMSGQRHLLDVTDTIRVEATGTEPVLYIGQETYVLPNDPRKFEQVKQSFESAWKQLDAIDPSQFSSR